MARLLVWRQNSQKASLRRGDIISVVPDGHEFSEWEKQAHMAIIDLPDTDLQKARQLTEKEKRPAVPGEPEYNAPDEPDRYVYTGENKWYFTQVNDKTVLNSELNGALTNREGSGLFLETGAGTYG